MEAGLAPEEPAAAALVGVAEQLPAAAAALHTDSHKRHLFGVFGLLGHIGKKAAFVLSTAEPCVSN